MPKDIVSPEELVSWFDGYLDCYAVNIRKTTVDDNDNVTIPLTLLDNQLTKFKNWINSRKPVFVPTISTLEIAPQKNQGTGCPPPDMRGYSDRP